MLSSAQTPEEYLEQLEDDWRALTLTTLRQIILEQGPELIERINYKMLCFGGEDTAVFHLNAQKNYVSLYVGNVSKIDPDGTLLVGLNVGKGCIRFKKSVSVSETQIDRFIARAIELWRSGEQIDC
ncbi:MAG: iron chaperone [Hyphomicrobiales bacterium]